MRYLLKQTDVKALVDKIPQFFVVLVSDISSNNGYDVLT